MKYTMCRANVVYDVMAFLSPALKVSRLDRLALIHVSFASKNFGDVVWVSSNAGSGTTHLIGPKIFPATTGSQGWI